MDVEMESENSEEELKSARPEKKGRGSLYKFKDTYLTKEEYNIATGKSLSYRSHNK